MSIVIGGGSGNAISINGAAGSAGQVVVSDGTNSSWVNGTGGSGAVYTSPGTFTVGTTCPSAVTSIKISCMGGGGNGGAGIRVTTPSPAGPSATLYAGGGGGAGVLAVRYYPVSNGQAYTITVGGATGTSSVSSVPAGTIISSTGGTSGGNAIPTSSGDGGIPAPVTQTGASYVMGSTRQTYLLLDAFGNSATGGLFPNLGVGGQGLGSLMGTNSNPPSTPNGIPYAGNVGTGYGVGGGGGIGGATPGATVPGGAGTSGIVIVEW
jgi:hypothetical protein